MPNPIEPPVETVRALRDTHAEAQFPAELRVDAQVAGVALALLDADIAGLADAFVDGDGTLRPDQWWTLRECADDAQRVLPRLSGGARAYFLRLAMLARAMLRHAPPQPPAS